MNVKFRPIEEWPGDPTPPADRRRSPFQAAYSATEILLDHELRQLDAEMIVIQLHLDESQIRLDGMPRSGASPRAPGVILSFESRHGPLRYFTDVFPHWHDNLRAIALGLEALRKVDRYGISKRGEQYTGWRQLEAGGGQINTREQAARFLSDHGGIVVTPDHTSPSAVGRAYRRASRKLHPDAGGDPEQFKKLQEARDLLLGEVQR